MKRQTRILLLISIFALAASSVAAEGISIAGRVLVPGGAPLPEADVQLLPLLDSLGEARMLLNGDPPQPAARTLTDAAGRFRLEAPHAGLWAVRVEAPGFASQETGIRPLIEPVELGDVELAADTGIKVRVTDGDGTPIAGARVLVRADVPRMAFFRSPWNAPLRSGLTGDDGTLRLPRGDGERTSVSVSAPGFVQRELRGLHGTAATARLASGKPEVLEVVSADGKPVEGVMLAVGGRPHPVGATDASGRIRAGFDPAQATSIALLAPDGRQLETRIEPNSEEKKKEEVRRLVLADQLSVVGRLIDADTLRSIPGGVIWDQANPADGTVTDRAGGFVLSGAVDSRLEITAGAPGYLGGGSQEFQLSDDGRPGPTLALHPAAAIEGTVTDADGNPIAGAEVEVQVKRAPGGMRIEIGRPAPMPRNVTTSEGKFRLSPLDPDKSYIVKAKSEGFAPAESTVSGLEPYATKSGVSLTLSGGQTVIGVLVDPSGNPIRDASIELTPGQSRHGMMIVMDSGSAAVSFTGSSDDDGKFRVSGLPAGKFDLDASRPGFATRRVPAIEMVEDAAPVDLGEITLEPGEHVQGIVTDRDGLPIEGVEVYVSEAGGMMMMVMDGGGPGPEAPEPDAVTDPTGWFTVSDLAPGKKYSLKLSRTGYVGSSAGPIQVPRVEPVEAVLDPASDVIGTVSTTGGEPIAGAQVNMTRSRTIQMGGNVMKTIMMMSATSDAQGQFIFEDQEPGEISLKAVASGYREAKLDGLEIPKGEDLEGVELPLDTGAVVQGRVLAPDGRPAIGASVRLAGEGEGFMRELGGTASDGNGYYRLEGLTPGTVSVEATHDDYPRTVKDIDADEGMNSLNLQFEGGFEVTGTVLGGEGDVVANASVRLVPTGRMWGGPETMSEADGTFNLPGVQDGSYRLWVEAESYAASTGKQQVTVAGEAVYGLEVRLDPGAVIVGRVTGLEPELFGDVNVRAEGESFGGFEGAGVDYEGNFRLENLQPGSYNVVASLARSGRQARGQVTLESGVGEARVDLEFGTGLTLSGQALQAERPIAGATIYVEGTDIDHNGWNETDTDGRFVIEGLEPGTYRLDLRHWQTGLAYNKTIELATTREIVIEVPTALVGGRIVGASDRQPLAGVSLTLTSDATELERLPIHTATTDLEGKFEFGNVADGTWRLAASKKGYAAVSRSVTVQTQRATGELDLTMDPTEGLTLEARLPSGGVPSEVRVAVLDPAGGALLAGEYATGEHGSVRLSSVPPGTWSIVVSAGGSATTTVQAQAPGATITVPLPPATALRVSVPALGNTGGMATASVADSRGRPFHSLTWDGRPQREFRMAGGQLEFASLPPGSWRVTVAAPDGQTWTGTATTTPGTTTTLNLE
jgi:uncharacterized GH25 family protein